MKCPYCDQEHLDDTRVCPNTGKQIMPVEQVTAESALSAQDIGLSTTEEGNQAEAIAAPVLDRVTVQDDGHVGSRPETLDQLPSQKAKPARQLLPKFMLGCVGIPLILLLLVVSLVFIDPFRLHVWGRIDGSYDAAAEMMPADTSLYLGVNLVNAYLTHIDRLWTPFLPSSPASSGSNYLRVLPAGQNQATPFDGLFQQILEDTGIKVPDDLTPWIGQYAGVGISGFDSSEYGTPIPTGLIIAIEARDMFRADAFLHTLADNLTNIRDTTFTSQTYLGAHIFVQEVKSGEKALSFGRSGKMILIATDIAILKDAIDGQGKQALSGEQKFNHLINHRQRNWSASLYVSPKLFTNLSKDLLQAAGGSPALPILTPYAPSNLSGMLLIASAINSGLRVDAYASYDLTSQPATDLDELDNIYAAPTQVINILPEKTVMYLANSRFDLFIQALMGTAFSDEGEKSLFFNDFETLFGFPMQEDLIDHLNGQWALYVVPSKNGILPQQANLNLAISFLAQTDNHLDLPSISNKINTWGPMSGINLSTQQVAGITYYQLSPGGEFPTGAVTFGQDRGFFTFGTDANILQSTFAQETLLVNLASYQNAVALLPAGMQPSVYIDFQRLFANIREGLSADEIQSFNDSIGELQHVRIIASANRMAQAGVLETSIILLISDQ